MMQFPSIRPDAADAGPTLWAIQTHLLARAEAAFGPRNQSKKIYQPAFDDKGPYLSNSKTMDGAFAILSLSAAGYWPTVIYELAHETVHLLDPVVGITNWLEEGAAVEFAIRMTRELTQHPMAPPLDSNYATAHGLVLQLPSPIDQSLAAIRSQFGSLSAVSAEQLAATFPSISRSLCGRLAEPCKPR